MEQTVGKIYQKIYRRACDAPMYKVEGSKDTATIQSFLKLIDKKYSLASIGNQFIYDYITFQFNYWTQKDTRFGKSVPIGWVFGAKAFKRWLERPNHWKHHTAKNLAVKGITPGILIGLNFKKPNALEIHQSEEQEKLRFLNDEIGFANCIESTTLYNHLSEYCQKCIHVLECKNLLKVNYLNVYLLRGYEL